MRFTDEILIAAPTDVVWQLTVDVEAWPELTPTITSVHRLDAGELQVGSQARIVQPRQRPAVWTVTELDAGRRFAWATTVLGITMTGTHVLEPTDDGGTRNTLLLDLAGRGSGLFGRVVGGAMRQAIHTENQGFRRRAEEFVAGDRA